MDTQHSFLVKLVRTCPTLPFMALGVWLAWTRLAFGGAAWVSVGIDTTNEMTILPFYTYSGIAFSATLLTIAALPTRFKNFVEKPAFPLYGGIIVAVSAFVIILLGPCVLGLRIGTPATYICYVSYAMTGVGTAFIALRCGQLYGTLPPRTVIMQMAISMMVMVGIYFCVTGAPEVRIAGQGPTYVGAFSFIALPLLAGFFAMLPHFADVKAAGQGQEIEDSCVMPRAFWRLLIAATLLSLASSVVAAYQTSISSVGQVVTDSSATMLFWGVVAVVFACSAVGLQAEHFRFGRIYSVIMALSALLIAVIPLSEFFSFNWGYGSAFAVCVFDFVFRCIPAFIVFQKRLSPVVVFGFGLGCHMLGGTLGWIFGSQVLPPIVETSGLTPFFILALIVLAAVFFLFSEKDFDRLFEQTETEDEKALSDLMKKAVRMGTGNPAVDGHEPRGRFKMAVDMVAEEYALSRREKEVLRYLAMGYESNAIAEKMGVSWNTVRTHTRNLYGKLDVHSKQEAVALVDSMVQDAF